MNLISPARSAKTGVPIDRIIPALVKIKSIDESSKATTMKSIFVVDDVISYKCLVQNRWKTKVENGYLTELGNLQIAEISRAYREGRQAKIPVGERDEDCTSCPFCRKPSWSNQELVFCNGCAGLFMRQPITQD